VIRLSQELEIVKVPCGACMFARRLLVKFNLREAGQGELLCNNGDTEVWMTPPGHKCRKDRQCKPFGPDVAAS